MQGKSALSAIPNTITLLNAISGCISITFAFEGNLKLAGIFILIAAVFDFFDGMVARLLHVSSNIGKELDSLSDAISFGVAPSVIASILVRNALGIDKLGNAEPLQIVACLLPFIMAALSNLRLAKFNLDERQTDKFIGLPTPANAMVWASLPFVDANNFAFAFKPEVIITLSFVLGILLVVELPLFAMKVKTLSWSANKIRYIFLAISIVLIACFKMISIPLIILTYVLLSIANNLFSKQ